MPVWWCAVNAVEDVVLPVEVLVVPWLSAAIAPVEFPVRHPYVEALWLPVLGPSATWMLRRLGTWAIACPGGTLMVLPELSESMGLGWASGQRSKVQRTIHRLVLFGMARWTGELEVRTTVPAVSDRQLARMSSGLVRSHDRMLAAMHDRAA